MKIWSPVSTLVIIATLLAACGAEATPTATPGLVLPTAQELKRAGQELFDTFSASIQSADAAALRGIFVADLSERCTAEQIQESLLSSEVPPFPNAEVRTVFLDLEDPSRALMQLALLDQPEGSLEAVALALTTPFAMVREDGEWRLSFPLLGIALGKGCPFAENSSQQASETLAPRTLTDQGLLEPRRLVPPPGVTSRGGGGGAGDGEFTSSLLLDTDMPLTELLDFYQQEVLEPEWEIQHKVATEDIASLTWTYTDAEGDFWLGVLFIAPAGEGLRRVRRWMVTGPAVQIRMVIPKGREPSVPAPVRPK